MCYCVERVVQGEWMEMDGNVLGRRKRKLESGFGVA